MPTDPEPSFRAPAGESLAERVRRDGPMQAPAVWTLACRLLDALDPVHASGAAHGGLDPENIVFPSGADGEPPLVFVNGSPAQATDASEATHEDLRQLGAALPAGNMT